MGFRWYRLRDRRGFGGYLAQPGTSSLPSFPGCGSVRMSGIRAMSLAAPRDSVRGFPTNEGG